MHGGVEIPDWERLDSEQVAFELLSPLDPQEFLGHTYRNRGRRFPARHQDRFAGLLTISEVESHLRTPHIFETTTVALYEPGRRKPEFADSAAKVYDRLSKGCTLQIGDFERALPDRHPLIRVFRSLEQLCQAPARGLTVFLSQAGGALVRHFDPYEIFTLQLQGHKRWEMFDFHPPSELDELDEDTEQAEPSEVFDVGPGDLLYTPKGQVHRVTPGEGLSFSAALVYDPPTWSRLIDVLAAAVADDERFWRSLPASDLETGFASHREALIAALEKLEAKDFADRIGAQRAAAIPGLPADHLDTALDVDSIKVDTRLRLRPGPRPVVQVDGEHVLLISAFDEPIRAPGRVQEALRYIVSSEASFMPCQLDESLSGSAKLAIVRKLARRGIVQIVHPDAARAKKRRPRSERDV